jgi:hypothetical protein
MKASKRFYCDVLRLKVISVFGENARLGGVALKAPSPTVLVRIYQKADDE